ncbi:glycosyltransferase involved in cell wall biosynthesis [Rhizobium sp. SG_E_25_P2]|uniref:glycosyltransferase n=1 Tax=Rhizobium sp. SG_E_25_P2 TaxID=2879942 RepID=UPI002474A231|nr:glycosyltransferase [Rhizobium sp. SG_E_25_P2]MDH6266888.1 glycosyltransferase involved in cell wall biosynthesis [Rhizobium sp. SG_E_25_P2]
MRVLMLSPLFPPYAQGGAELSAHGLAQWLIGKGHDVVVLTAAKGVSDEIRGERRDGVTLYRFHFPRPYSIHRQGRGVSRWLKPLWHLQDHIDPRNRRILDNVLDAVRPDIVTLHSLIGLGHRIVSALATRDIPTLYVLPDLALACLRATMFRQGRACVAPCVECRLSSAYKQAALCLIPRLGYVSPSQANLKRLAAAGALGDRPARVIANVNAYPEPRQPRTSSSAPRFVYVGRLDAPKGVHCLLRAAEAARREVEFTLTLVGSGGEETALRRAFVDCDWLDFTGWLPLQDAVETIHQADALCLPSLWPENLPGSAVIALRHGVPILASSTGGLPELVRDGIDGRLLPPGDTAAWRDALIELARRPQQLAAMRPAAREASRRFDPDRLGEAYLDFMEDIRNRRAARDGRPDLGLVMRQR